MSRSVRSRRLAVEPIRDRAVSAVWPFGIGLLLSARYLQPTEAVVFGETLWQAQLWLVLAAAWCWGRWRSKSTDFRLSLLDGFVWLLVVGHAISTTGVLFEGGDRRAAVNVAWEWVGLAAMLFIVRQVFAETHLRRLIALFAAMMVGLASLGIWQHHVSLGETAERFGSLLEAEAELTERVAVGTASSADRQRLLEVQRELAEAGVPMDEASRRQWKNRVQHSSEPFATFALANTLGGLLAAAVPVLVAVLWPIRRDVRWAAIAVAATAVLYCLVLTKSRTAWVGLVAGGISALMLFFVRGRLNRRVVSVAAASSAVIVLLGLAVLATGGLDREVFAEAPKSLQYRIDYWTGTFGVLSERPVLGTGPGNFRSYYLEHRPIGASEAVAAPHNLLLDVWVSGGLLSLFALASLLAYTGVRFAFAEEPIAADGKTVQWTPFETGAVIAFPTVVVLLFFAGSGFDLRVLAVWPLVGGVLYCLMNSNETPWMGVGAGAGFVALAVHLLGADGIELPAVVQSLLLLCLVVDRPQPVGLSSWGMQLVPVILMTGLALAAFITGVAPVLNAGALTARAEAALTEGDPNAERLLRDAAAADPLADRPRLLLAELATAKATNSRSSADFESAERQWSELLERDPRSVHVRQRLAALLLNRDDSDLTDRALALLERAVELSPTDAGLRVEFARALAKAGRSEAAAAQAASALRIDAINRAAMHTDLLLDDATRAELKRLSPGVGNPGESP